MVKRKKLEVLGGKGENGENEEGLWPELTKVVLTRKKKEDEHCAQKHKNIAFAWVVSGTWMQQREQTLDGVS